MKENWKKIPHKYSITLEQTLYIIYDALCYGFEFKVENHAIYYREIGE